ncbi:hypothetical protein NL676_038410 [Syzygium grande]|nr:hypothetical protein NL676_038410 [Syzygium grande]
MGAGGRLPTRGENRRRRSGASRRSHGAGGVRGPSGPKKGSGWSWRLRMVEREVVRARSRWGGGQPGGRRQDDGATGARQTATPLPSSNKLMWGENSRGSRADGPGWRLGVVARGVRVASVAAPGTIVVRSRTGQRNGVKRTIGRAERGERGVS